MKTLEEYRNILEKSFLFSDMEKDSLPGLWKSMSGKTESLCKGQMIICEGDYVNSLGVILKGEVCIARIDQDGNERLFQKLGESYMLGADIVSTPARNSPYTAYCSQDSVIWFFPWDIVEKDESMAYLKNRLMEFIANENIRKFYRIDILSSKSVRSRILKYLRIQCKKAGSSTVYISYSREEFANYLCVNRSVLSDELSRMQQEGILSFRKNKFTLHEGAEIPDKYGQR